jgi:hypothetical protein
MAINRNIRALLCAVVVCCISGCQAPRKTAIDEREVQGFRVKTFVNDQQNIEVTVASDGTSTIVAIPRTSIALRRQMGDAEYKCLKACKDIADTQKRVDCIVLCPVTKYHVAILK